jgi:hypothetical protein
MTLRDAVRRWGNSVASIKAAAAWPPFYPALLLFIGILTYLYVLPQLGYYWDDWEVVFLLNAGDRQLFADYFAFDRPFAWPYQVMHALFGLQPLAWHIVTLLLRVAAILLLYAALTEVWPRQRVYLRWVGVLLLVYPGYLQQSISGAYNRHFTAFFLFGISIYLMVLSTRKHRLAWIYAAASWIAAFLQMWTIEYFVGLELARPFLLWQLVLRQDRLKPQAAFRKALLLSVPYLVILICYAWWRLIVFPSTIPVANYAGDFKLLRDFDLSVISGTLSVLTRAFLDLVYSTLQVWLAVLSDPEAWTFQGKISWFAFGLGALLAIVFAYFHDVRGNADKGHSSPPLSMAWFGLLTFLVGALPVWLTSKQLSQQGRWDDRFALAPMLGAGVLVIWLVASVVRARMQRVVLAVLLALSITTQILVVNRYRLDWGIQNQYYWQLHWRVPALKPGTAIITFEQPAQSVPGYDASFAMNVLFDGKVEDDLVPYWFFTNDRFLNFDLEPERTISYRDRNLRFRGNTSEALSIIHQGASRCLQVLDEPYADQPFYGTHQEQLVRISNVSRILGDSASEPDPRVFGPEPPRTWCYYFQKADLARQFMDWEAVIRLEHEARSRGYSPGFGVELLPFIEAHARLGDWQGALDLSLEAQGIISEMEPVLCSTWTRIEQLPEVDLSAVRAARQAFACSAL